nr:hypothetical protein [Kofleriaceae bacterium]
MLDDVERSLLARIAAGDDVAADAIAAHWLDHGDAARGRFVQVERALVFDADDADLLAERRHLLRKHRERWWAAVRASGFSPDALAFVGGFVATPLVLGAGERDLVDELFRLSPRLYRDRGDAGITSRTIHDARAATAADPDGDAGDPVLLVTGDASAVGEPPPVNQLVLRDRALSRVGPALVLPGGVDVARVLGVRATGNPLSLAAPGAALGVSFAVSVAIEACRALAPLHTSGHRHGRITPENILLDAAGNAIVVSLYPTDWVDPDVPWRHEWMWHLAPEQLPGPEDDPRTDVFALGLVMATLVSGRHPAARAATTPHELMLALRDRRLELPEASALPPAIAAVLRAALGAADDRFPDALALGRALAGAAAADAVPFGSAIIADTLDHVDHAS